MDISIPLKNNENNWLNIDDKQKIQLKYPSDVQQEELNQIMFNIALKKERLNSIKDECIKAELEASMLADSIKYQKYYIKITIKNWEGFPIECKLVNNELENDLWRGIVENAKYPEQYMALYSKIHQALEFNEDDKKKL